MGRTRIGGETSKGRASRRCGGQRERRLLVERLESRLLLTSTLLPIIDHHAFIFDATRNQLDIVRDGGVSPYDLATATVLPQMSVPGSPGPGDITPDGHYLLLTDHASQVIHRLDLTTGTDAEFVYSTAGYGGESNPNTLVAVSNTRDYASVRTQGKVTLSTPLAIGTHSITAVYSGDANYHASSSSSITVTVSQITTSVRLTTSNLNAHQGEEVTFTAVVSAASTADGTASFFDGTTLLGTSTLSGGYAT